MVTATTATLELSQRCMQIELHLLDNLLLIDIDVGQYPDHRVETREEIEVVVPADLVLVTNKT